MKLSIITINYNNKSGLEKTCESVLNQSEKYFEWIALMAIVPITLNPYHHI